jgi:hypothetical protein
VPKAVAAKRQAFISGRLFPDPCTASSTRGVFCSRRRTLIPSLTCVYSQPPNTAPARGSGLPLAPVK